MLLVGRLTQLTHLAFDALLVAMVLAGVKRSTGLAPALAKIKNRDLRALASSYLELGEWAMDFSVVFMGRSSAFERRR
ncbi:hypothetical protein DMC30DRAFT_412943 [Rhodotorula diobovata]|uniref:DUF1748-domain-containing protein n=1 Tax=Rhodotorula diobovata TaxID=5288 RepID=A0A5C5G6E6_9BASI|nr:hypothetical protein DMC30DRAFT_412943 [Rhodotorula diobovata]